MYGKVNVYTPSAGTQPAATDPLSHWDGTYAAQLSTAGKYEAAGNLVIATHGNTTTVTYKGQQIRKYTFATNQLSSKASDVNPQSASVLFFSTTTATAKNPTTGPQFFGKLWPAGGSPATAGNFYGSIHHNVNPAGGAAQGASVDEWRTLGRRPTWRRRMWWSWT